MKIDRPDSFLLLERSKKEEGRGRGGEDEKKGEKGNENRWTEFCAWDNLNCRPETQPEGRYAREKAETHLSLSLSLSLANSIWIRAKW